MSRIGKSKHIYIYEIDVTTYGDQHLMLYEIFRETKLDLYI